MAGDWVAPYGKGANIDITFTEAFNKKSIMDYDYQVDPKLSKARRRHSGILTGARR